MEEQRRVSIPLIRINRKKESTKLKGPLRLVRLCILSILLPGILIAGPLYLRYRVYSRQLYPIGMSDMRLVDGKISTTWCQRQLVKSNATFNAYLLPEEPQVKSSPVLVSIVKHLDLQDDMKEYWGFYLLKGSSFTVSPCCRWPGGYLAVIQGHKSLLKCAFEGDNSSEEEDELKEINGGKKNDEQKVNDKEDDAKSNEPWMMRKARPGVIFHKPQQENQLERNRMSKEVVGETENEQFSDWFSLKNANKIKKKVNFSNKKSNNVNNVKDFSEKSEKLKQNTEYRSSQTSFSPKQGKSEEKLEFGNTNTREVGNKMTAENKTRERGPEIDGKLLESRETKKKESEEIFQDVLSKILGLGNRGKKMLMRLNEKLTNDSREQGKTNPQKKREIQWHSMYDDLNRDDENENRAEEEGSPMEKEIHGSFNGTTINDRSDSEYWSSFSSSEERLISCSGLIANIPLMPMKGCDAGRPEEEQAKASLENKFTYTVPTNGYYFFVFSSENEIQPNYIWVEFQLEKIMYNVSNPVAVCKNTTESCSLPLNFFSREKTVLEMPVPNNDSMWNQEYVVVSVCEPRTMVYAACVIAVPVLILLFAF